MTTESRRTSENCSGRNRTSGSVALERRRGGYPVLDVQWLRPRLRERLCHTLRANRPNLVGNRLPRDGKTAQFGKTSIHRATLGLCLVSHRRDRNVTSQSRLFSPLKWGGGDWLVLRVQLFVARPMSRYCEVHQHTEGSETILKLRFK